MAEIPLQHHVDRQGRPLVIRTAQASDAGRLLGYLRTVFADNEFFTRCADELSFTEEHEEKWLDEQRVAPARLVLLAVSQGAVVGSLSFENGAYRRVAHRGTLGISVLPEWRGSGVGTALLTAFLRWAEAHPALERVSLEVFSSNPRAIALYRKLGFVEDGRRPRDVRLEPGRYVDTITMHRWVKEQQPQG